MEEVFNGDGNITGNVDNVLNKWKADFAFVFKDKDGFDDLRIKMGSIMSF